VVGVGFFLVWGGLGVFFFFFQLGVWFFFVFGVCGLFLGVGGGGGND